MAENDETHGGANFGSGRVVFVVSLWLNGNDVAGFEAFERAAAGIMGAYGGRIESVVRCGGTDAMPFEIHVVSFPDLAARDAYRRDPALAALGWLRERVIARTEICQGESRPSYIPRVDDDA